MHAKTIKPFSRSAFSLVELLVVVGIIALLLAILVPSMGTTRETANRTKCQSHLRQLGVVNHAYSVDNGSFIYIGFNGNIELNGVPAGQARYWAVDRRILARLGMHDGEIANIYKPGQSNWGAQWPSRFLCPSWTDAPDPWDHHLSYGYNCYKAYQQDKNAPRAWHPARVVKPANKVAYADAQGWHTPSKQGDYKRYWDIYGEAIVSGGKVVYTPGEVRYRHDEGTNVCYFDGSAGWLAKEDAWHYKNDGTSTDWERVRSIWWPHKVSGQSY